MLYFLNANRILNLKLVICICSKNPLSGLWTSKVKETQIDDKCDDKVFFSVLLGNTDSQVAYKILGTK